MKTFTNRRKIKSKILPHLIPFYLHGFYNDVTTGHTLALEDIDCSDWFQIFIKKLTQQKEKKFFPICRLSDGEYTFICGNQPPIKNFLLTQILSSIKFCFENIKPKRQFEAGESGIYHSGKYLRKEISEYLPNYLNNLKELSEVGILALHLTYSRNPFQERFHFALNKIFETFGIKINANNYFPFYFVYAFFQTNEFYQYIKHKNVLFITGSDEQKMKLVEKKFMNFGAKYIEFYSISSNRSLFDILDLRSIKNKNVDICFVAAGIGKPNIMVQLKPLECICIDVGYMFEVWANENLAYNRPWCSKNFKVGNS